MHSLLFSIWFLEIICAALLFLGLILTKLFYDRSQYKKRVALKKMKPLFFSYITEQKELYELESHFHTLSPLFLLEALEEYQVLFNCERWKQFKKHLCQTILVPWAKKRFHSKRWIHRNYCVRIFLISGNEKESRYLYKLLEDPDYYIRYLAVQALGEINHALMIEPLVMSMQKETPPCRFIYRYVLMKLPYATIPHLFHLYMGGQKESVRLCCLDILMYRFHGNLYRLLRRDLFSKNDEIRQKVAASFKHFYSKEALVDLEAFLKDPHPSVRAETLRSICQLKPQELFFKVIKKLSDPAYEVRFEAAKTLKEWGREGRRVLEEQDWDLDQNAYEVARQVLTL